MEIKEISFSYDGKTPLLEMVSGQIHTGKITTIIGPNGSGKSTLLGIMSRNYLPNAGEVVLDGKAIYHYKAKHLAKKIAVVHQQNEAPMDMTVEKLVGFGRLPHQRFLAQPSEADERAIEWALACTKLTEKRHHRLQALSGGERQRVWIAMSLAQRAPMLFLDEPTTYLDIYYQLEILELIKRLNQEQGLTIVMVLHDMNQAIRYSDQIMIMKEGHIVANGNADEVMTVSRIKQIYGVDVVVQTDPKHGLYVVPLGIEEAEEQGNEATVI
ncbi:iron ABC transporter ATP-binding protein [Ammoniphilus oxalaticus]|uniref:Iron ABC transporter ATP-binding protein n=1 Tax=Ammoniphilus oxalaticus TaxID=66863 RepID=A0A419SGM7_9BACL|nr:ABC transporter ATP-binding protein [Ammoniphilus oxalaticus]RKD22928.1 iron ABC transporter ATP-binding protein [Ammoniphilus oxalaticus]